MMEFTADLIQQHTENQYIDKKILENQKLSLIFVTVLMGPLIGIGALSLSGHFRLFKNVALYFIIAAFLLPGIVAFFQSYRNKQHLRKILPQQLFENFKKKQPWEKIGSVVLNEEKIIIEDKSGKKEYFLKDVNNLEIKNEFELNGKRGVFDTRAYQNNFTWNPARIGFTNYISFRNSDRERIYFNFLINNEYEVEDLQTLFKQWKENGVSFRS